MFLNYKSGMCTKRVGEWMNKYILKLKALDNMF